MLFVVFFIRLLFADLPLSRHIVELTSTKKVREDNNTIWMVVFCDKGSKCTDFMFEYVKLADHLYKTPNAKFARVECPSSGEVCTIESVKKVPRIKLYYKGSVMDYDGLENEKAVTAWYTDSIADNGTKIINYILPTTEFVKPLNDWDSFKDATAEGNSDFWFIIFYRDGGANCRKLVPVFNKVSIELSDIPNLRFGRVDCPNADTICMKIKGVPSFQLFHKGQFVEYNANRELNTADMISTWIVDGMASAGGGSPGVRPLPSSEYVREFTDLESLRAVQAPESAVFWVITYFRNSCPHCRRWMPEFNAIAGQLTPSHPDTLKFGRVNCPLTGPVCDLNDIKGVPTIMIYYKGAKTECIEGLRDADSVTKWLIKVMANDGHLIKNPPPPLELPRSANVVQLNDSNFPSLVENTASGDFWFLTFYRPNCAHCHRFLPTLNALANNLTGTVPRLKFGRVDCVDPNATGVCTKEKAQRVPAIRLYYKGSKIELDVSRDIDSITAWITEAMANDGAKVTNPSSSSPPPPPPSPPTPATPTTTTTTTTTTSPPSPAAAPSSTGGGGGGSGPTCGATSSSAPQSTSTSKNCEEL